jgi:hypothetical protein
MFGSYSIVTADFGYVSDDFVGHLKELFVDLLILSAVVVSETKQQMNSDII